MSSWGLSGGFVSVLDTADSTTVSLEAIRTILDSIADSVELLLLADAAATPGASDASITSILRKVADLEKDMKRVMMNTSETVAIQKGRSGRLGR